jgi:hypothetical protein
MPRTSAGAYLVIASAAFWASWLLMPGVGVTDTATIFALVGPHRARVLASVVLQLLSAAMYAPGIGAILATTAARRSAAIRAGGALLLIGAMGSAADAIYHLIAYEMTAPGIAFDAVAPVMRRLQGKDLALLLPFVAAFLLGHSLLVATLRKRGSIATFGARVLFLAPLIVLAGGPAARAGFVTGRIVGLSFLGVLAGSLALLGLSLIAEEPEPQG